MTTLGYRGTQARGGGNATIRILPTTIGIAELRIPERYLASCASGHIFEQGVVATIESARPRVTTLRSERREPTSGITYCNKKTGYWRRGASSHGEQVALCPEQPWTRNAGEAADSRRDRAREEDPPCG